VTSSVTANRVMFAAVAAINLETKGPVSATPNN
jgi:hypothetical protein